MGQQQLLLIALSVIIVGAAVAVGVNLLTQGQSQADLDKFYQMATQAGTEFGKWYSKPVAMGGGGKDVTKFPATIAQQAAILGLEYQGQTVHEADVWMSAVASDVASVTAYVTGGPTPEGILVTLINSDGQTALVVLSGSGRARWDDTANGSIPPSQAT